MNQTVEIQRYLEGMMNKLALGGMVDYSYQEAMEICHWMKRRVRVVGAEWYISAELIDGRYAIRYDSGDEYVTLPGHVLQRWEVVN